METTRATVYLDAQLHRALRLKSATTHRSMSQLINQAVRDALSEDEEDLAALETRADEPALPYEDFLKQLKADGTL